MRFTEPGPVSENRRYFYISFLRDPVSRYLSEWRHVARGATWDGAELKCGGVEWGQRLPRCWGEEEEDPQKRKQKWIYDGTLAKNGG